MGASIAADDDLTQLDLGTLMKMDVTLVTAQKRSEDVNTVPISMEVFKVDQIRRNTLNSTVDLQTAVPGLTTSSIIGLMLPYIRGMGVDSATSVEPSVSVYVDGVYQPDRSQTFVDFADVEQVEVLRGPQGTLYGRNSTGGAIKVETRGPTATWVGDSQVSAGNLGLRDGSMFVGGPLSERVRVSLSSHVRQKESYYESIIGLPMPDSENFYAVNGRMQMDIAPSLDAEVLLRYFKRDDSVAPATEISGNSLPSMFGVPVATQPFTTAINYADAPNRVSSRSAALKLNWSTDAMNVRSTTSYTDLMQRTAADLDASAATLIHVDSHLPGYSLIQEFQLSPAQSMEHFDWLAGAFYMDANTRYTPLTIDTPLDPNQPLVQVIYNGVRTQAYAAFGEATVRFDQRFSLTAGLRYSNESKYFEDAAAGVVGAPLQASADQSDTWDDVNYRLVAKYAVGNSMLYAKTETGFKAGAYNNYNPRYPGPVGPETVTAYEIGIKHGFAELPVQISAAVFHNDIHNLQMQLFDEDLSQVFVSAPRAEASGVDASVQWKATQHWSLSAGASWLEAQYGTFFANGVLTRSPLGGNAPLPTTNLEGNDLARSPRFTANVSTSFDYPLGPGSLVGGAIYYRSSEFYFDAANEYEQRGFGVLNVNLGYQADSGWSVTSWARNLTDATYLAAAIVSPIGAMGQYAEPRAYGLSVGYRFGK